MDVSSSLCLTLSTICVFLQPSVYGSQLVSKGRSISSSSIGLNLTPDKAVDGDARRVPNVCHCCAATNIEFEPWYKVDLGQAYMVNRVSVLGRGGPGDDDPYGLTLLNMEIKLGTGNTGGTVLTRNTQNVYEFDYTLPTPQSGRYVTLTLRETTQFFLICELYIYAECDTHTYGPGCSQLCGKCLNDEKCDSDDGSCGSCAAGYQGIICTQVCDDGYFGANCSERCFCAEGPCNTETGVCPPGGCQPGYQGIKCDTDGELKTKKENVDGDDQQGWETLKIAELDKERTLLEKEKLRLEIDKLKIEISSLKTQERAFLSLKNMADTVSSYYQQQMGLESLNQN